MLSRDRNAPAERPAHILDGEEMKRLEETPVVLSLPSALRQAGAEHRMRVPQSFSSIFVDIGSGP